MANFTMQQMVSFQHCDPAGLIFYVNYFHLGFQVMENWFMEGLGLPHGEMVVKQKIGVPTVHIEADFLAPSRLEEVLDFSLQITRLGQSSVTMQIDGHHQGEHRCRIKQVIVFVDLNFEEIKNIPIPQDIRARMQKFVGPDEE